MKSSAVTEPLFCTLPSVIPVQRGLPAERVRESMCKKSGTSANSPHPYCCCLQSEECCISWGQCRGREKRLASVQVTVRQTKSRESEMGRVRWTAVDKLQHSLGWLSAVGVKRHTVRGQEWEWSFFFFYIQNNCTHFFNFLWLLCDRILSDTHKIKMF